MEKPVDTRRLCLRTIASLLAEGHSEEQVRVCVSHFGLAEADSTRLFAVARASVRNLAAHLTHASLPRTLKASALNDFLKKQVTHLKPLLLGPSGKAVVSRPCVSQIHGYRGTGKSNVAFDLSRAMATGAAWLKFTAPEPLKTLYVEGEQPDADLQEQLLDLVGNCDNFWLMTMEEQDGKSFPKISTTEGQLAFETYLLDQQFQVVVFDSLSTLANIPMNDEEEQIKLSDWFIRLRTALGISVVYLQHDGKTGNQRGHSKHEDWLNLSIGLSWPEDYYGQEGLKVYMRFDKARRYSGDTEELLVQLVPALDEGKPEWCWKKATEAMVKRQEATELVRKVFMEGTGLTNNDLADLLKKRKLSFKADEMKDMIKKQRELFQTGGGHEPEKA
jgi:RecA-family ATPase